MNTLHLSYALEVEKTGSITQAAENLFMSQPTLSKAIKDLEAGLGFSVFKRTPRGVVPTQRGQEFLAHARKIVAQIDKMEQALHAQDTANQLFSLAIPRVSYIARAASEYICSFDNSRDMEIDLLETTSLGVVEAVSDSHFVLGVIRCHVEDQDYFFKYLEEKGLQHETVWQSDYVALMREDHPLAQAGSFPAEALCRYTEVLFGDSGVPYIRVSQTRSNNAVHSTKRMLVYDRATQFDLLRANPQAYMWVSPLPPDLLERNGLVQRKCKGSGQFRDLLIYRAGYRFSALDRAFIDKLYLQRNEAAYSF